MAGQSIKKQAAVLTGANLLVRCAGFVMRIIFSRLLGAETMGIMELASSAHMLAITPATAGLPLGISRLTAKAAPTDKTEPLAAGRWLVNRLALALMPLFLLCSPWIAHLLGDMRTWPSLLFTVPCIFVLGHSAALNGYCYGMGQALPPALSEMLEQFIRFGLSMGILCTLPHLSAAWTAAVPAFATLVAETAGLVLVIGMLRLPRSRQAPARTLIQKTARLSAPPTFSRFCNTGLRSLNAIFIPLRLQASGLPLQEATARFGMLTGMAMPLMMLPGVFTGALSLLAAPALASREENPRALRAMALRLTGLALMISCLCAVALYAAAPFIAQRLYRQAELAELLRLMSPSIVLMGVHQVLSGMIAGVGRQKHALYGTLLGAALTLGLSWFLTALPPLRQNGAALAMMAGQGVTLIWNLVLMARVLVGKGRSDKSAPTPSWVDHQPRR